MAEAIPGQSPEGRPDLVAAPSVVRATSLDRDPLKRDFKNFLWRVWRELGYTSPTALQYDMADWLQYGPDKAITMGFRGVAKSYVTVPFCVHALYCDPDELVFSISATAKFAGTNAQFAYQMITKFEWLQHMMPRTDQRRSALGFDVRDATPKKFESFWSDSIFGQITGRRFSLGVPDDIEVPKTSDTDTVRDQLRKAFGEFSGACALPKARIKILGTSQNEQSIYPELATEKGYGMRMWPILYPSPDERPKFGSWLAPMLDADLAKNPALVHTSTEPTRFDEADIAERELEFGRTEFARQFKLFLDAGQGTQAPLKLADLIVMDWAPPASLKEPLKLPPEVRWSQAQEHAIKGLLVDSLHGDLLHGPGYVSRPEDYRAVEVMRAYIDPSGSGTDETTCTVGAQLNALVFVCAQKAWMEGHSEATLDGIAEMLKLWQVQYVFVESNFGQGMFGQLLQAALQKAHHPCIVEEDRKSQVQKERRVIETLEPPVTSHRVVVNSRVFKDDYEVDYDEVADAKRRFYRLSYQLTRITKTKGSLSHDDRVDGLASLVGKFQDILRQRTEDAIKNDRENAIEAEIELARESLEAQMGTLMGDNGGPPMEDTFGRPRIGVGSSRVFGRRRSGRTPVR